MQISDQGIAFLVAHEGVVPAPYLDSKGIWTFGIGHTKAAGAPDPSKMERGVPANVDRALAYAFEVFRQDLRRYEADVLRVIGGRKVAQHEFDAAVSFHFNTGAIGNATWVKTWLAGDKAKAAEQIMQWRRPPEIIPRREAERDLFAKGRYGAKTASVWPVNSNNKPVWKPLRTLTQAQIVALVRPGQPAPKPARPVAIPSLNEGAKAAAGNFSGVLFFILIILVAIWALTKG